MELLLLGANVNLVDKVLVYWLVYTLFLSHIYAFQWEHSALHYAVSKQYVDCADVLVKAGAPTEKKNSVSSSTQSFLLFFF